MEKQMAVSHMKWPRFRLRLLKFIGFEVGNF
jgi:hypothetical protein